MPLQDYAIIGNCRSAALVSRAGSIDWLCWPRFDSASIFGALLDERAGRWSIAPRDPQMRTERRYEQDTNVLQTTFTTDTGKLTLTDLMPVMSDHDLRRFLTPEHEVVRIAECTQGEIDVELIFDPRPDYGRGKIRLRDDGSLGLRAEFGSALLCLRTTLPLELGESGARGRTRLRGGESIYSSLTYADSWPGVFPPLGDWTRETLSRSVDWWRAWASRMTYQGRWKGAVSRSALVLKLLAYAPSGAVIAAPTTSLPERIGGSLNWDYRFCWLRDASLTVRALFGIGHVDEADAFVGWLLHSTRLSRPRLRALYDVYGKLPPKERVLEHLTGYLASRPVRVGNAAAQQFQLDVFGEVIDATTMFVQSGGTLDRETQGMLRAFGKYVSRNWRQADEGIWEPRSGRTHHTHSRVLCWVALDRLVQLCEKGQLKRAPIDEYRRTRDAIRMEVEERSWNPEIEAYTGQLDGSDLNAAELLLPWYGFAAADSDRMRKTYTRIRKQLGARHGLLYRYRSGRPAKGHLASAASGPRNIWRWEAGRSRKPPSFLRTCWRSGTTWACTARKPTRPRERRWVISLRRLPT